MKKLNSKWYYVSLGQNIQCVIIGVLVHSALLFFGGFIGAIFAWHIAEKRRTEEQTNG